jgi:hypothetical protein
VMPIESLSFMPTGVVDDEQSAFGVQRRDFLGQKIEIILEDIGIDSVKNHRAAFSSGRTHRADDVGSDMVSEIRHFWATGQPATPRRWPLRPQRQEAAISSSGDRLLVFGTGDSVGNCSKSLAIEELKFSRAVEMKDPSLFLLTSQTGRRRGCPVMIQSL